jgi:SAM-dependent methyltransferase
VGSHEQGPPFDLTTTRIRLLYQIPIAPARGRALEFSIDGNSILRGRNWAGEFTIVDVSGSAVSLSAAGADAGSGDGQLSVCVADYAKALPFSDGSIDVVVLHRTLDHLPALAKRQARAFVIRDFLKQVARILAPGGLVLGCVENRYGLEHLVHGAKRALRRTGGVPGESGLSRPLSVPGCHRALAAAGFEEIRLFSMVPAADSPFKALSIEPGWSRRACLRQVEAMRTLVGPSSYVVWRTLAELGISQYFSAAVCFWGRKGQL